MSRKQGNLQRSAVTVTSSHTEAVPTPSWTLSIATSQDTVPITHSGYLHLSLGYAAEWLSMPFFGRF